LKLYEPKYEDLWFRQQMLADEENMSYNHNWGGTISFPEEEWMDWYDHWINDHDKTRFYRYLINEDDQYVGEIAYHYDEDMRSYMADVIIYSPYRRTGSGNEAFQLLCVHAKDNGIRELYDDIAIDNPAIKLFLNNGFIEQSRTKEKVILKKVL
ncbi:MAG: GNAT family N-acetyltransferase, partial [Erysipelotrichaceae bacterium]|nr:GNAT family N-acetyltransferase [Erysipelotrichaceae bacterium]